MKIIKTASGKNKIKISKKEWKSIGKKAGWVKVSKIPIIPSDGIRDGGTPYTDEEMNLIERKDNMIQVKDEIARLIDGFDENSMSKEDFELKMKELIGKMYKIKGAHLDMEDAPNPYAPDASV